jgi:hypothetical protein
MTDKWADFVITAVRFNSAGTHIEEVQTYEHADTALINQTTKNRHTVVTQIESGYTYCTATKGSDGKWYKGAEVSVVTIDDEKFIKTKADTSKKDNLDNLPTF